MSAMLVLFDIDGTLLHSLRAGVGAMKSALAQLHGIEADFDAVEIHGRLDTLIWKDLGRRHGYPLDEAAHATFKRTYIEHLRERFAKENTSRAHPGALELVAATRAAPGATIGLLTGNYEGSGRLKVQHAGFDPDHFVVNAWGDDGPDRRSLVPVAMERYRAMHGRAIDPRRVVIIGDTPADVDCARSNGARVIGVATGTFGVDALREAGADLVVPNLTDTPGIVRWMAQG